MNFSPLKSSNIEGAHYDEASQTLTVKFKNGGRYSYGGVVKEHYDGLMGAESAGSYFHKTIKGAYKHKRLDDDDAK